MRSLQLSHHHNALLDFIYSTLLMIQDYDSFPFTKSLSLVQDKCFSSAGLWSQIILLNLLTMSGNTE